MDAKQEYRQILLKKVRETKALYEVALFNYNRIDMKALNWEEQIDSFNLAKMNYETAKSRLDGLKRLKQVQGTQTVSFELYNR